MTRRNRQQTHWEQLPELLLAMAVGMIVAGAALQLLIRVWSETRDTYKQTATLQETQLIRKEWRRFVHKCSDPLTRSASGSLIGKTASVKTAPGNSLLLTLRRRQRKLPIPDGMVAQLDVENSPQGTPLAVLTLEWSSREGDRKVKHSRRIVAANSAWRGRS